MANFELRNTYFPKHLAPFNAFDSPCTFKRTPYRHIYGDIHDMSTCGGGEIALHLLDLRPARENLLSLTQGGPLPIIGAKRSAKVQSASLQPATRMRTLSDARHSNARHLSRYVWRNMAQCATRAKLSVNSAVSGVGLLITLNKPARTVCLFSDQHSVFCPL